MSANTLPIGTMIRRTVRIRAGWMSTAIFFLILFGALHLLGWRDDTAFLCGTSTSANPRAAALRGVFYVLAYFAATIGSPVLIIASGINALISKMTRRDGV